MWYFIHEQILMTRYSIIWCEFANIIHQWLITLIGLNSCAKCGVGGASGPNGLLRHYELEHHRLKQMILLYYLLGRSIGTIRDVSPDPRKLMIYIYDESPILVYWCLAAIMQFCFCALPRLFTCRKRASQSVPDRISLKKSIEEAPDMDSSESCGSHM